MNLGYACINMELAEQGVTTNRGMTRKTFLSKGISYASELALQNVRAFRAVLEWNLANHISVFRVTSELFPWASEYEFESLPDFAEIRSELEAAGRLPIRISSHPGPFNKLAGTGVTLENTLRELEIHARIFDLMNLSRTHWNKINIHVGGAYGDKPGTLRNFARNYRRLSDSARSRLTVENDDKPGLFTVADLVSVHQDCGIPIVFDYFHHRLHPGGLSEEEAFHAAYATWDVKPLFHYSSSRREREDPTAKKEAHSDWAHERIATYGKDVDIILETKMKERSVLRYRQQFEA